MIEIQWTVGPYLETTWVQFHEDAYHKILRLREKFSAYGKKFSAYPRGEFLPVSTEFCGKQRREIGPCNEQVRVGD